MTGTDVATYTRERPGMSAFALEDGVVYHTYSAYARGLDGLWGMYQWLDRAPKGRNETGSGGAATTSTARADSSICGSSRSLSRAPLPLHRPAATTEAFYLQSARGIQEAGAGFGVKRSTGKDPQNRRGFRMATGNDLRRIALSLEGTTEAPHFDRAAFKVARIYVTLAARPARQISSSRLTSRIFNAC